MATNEVRLLPFQDLSPRMKKDDGKGGLGVYLNGTSYSGLAAPCPSSENAKAPKQFAYVTFKGTPYIR